MCFRKASASVGLSFEQTFWVLFWGGGILGPEHSECNVLISSLTTFFNLLLTTHIHSPFSGTEDEQCEIMDQLVKEYGSSDGGYVQCKALASALADLLQDQFEGKIFPSEVINTGGQNSIEEAVEDSIGKPLFVIFRALCEMTDSDPHRGKISKV